MVSGVDVMKIHPLRSLPTPARSRSGGPQDASASFERLTGFVETAENTRALRRCVGG